MEFTREEIIKAIEELYESPSISGTKLIEIIKKNIVEGNIEQTEIQHIINLVNKPIQELDEDGNVVNEIEQKLFSDDELFSLKKIQKRKEIKQSCYTTIINGFDTDIKYGEPKHYSLDEFAQKNIDDQMIQLQAGEIKNALWHDDSRVTHDLWTFEEFREFFTHYKMFILSCRLKSDILEEKVIAVTDVAELNNISFDNPLSEEEQLQINTLITGMIGTTEV